MDIYERYGRKQEQLEQAVEEKNQLANWLGQIKAGTLSVDDLHVTQESAQEAPPVESNGHSGEPMGDVVPIGSLQEEGED